MPRVALVIIDLQRDVVEPHGFGTALEDQVEPLQKIVLSVASLLKTFREWMEWVGLLKGAV
jgi:nicotinamidase-related amidase